MAGKLTPKQSRFCEEYLIDLNLTQAALRSGYGKTEGSAAVAGHQLLRNPKVQERINQLKEEQSKRTGITADRVLQELGRIAFLDLSSAYDDKGNLKILGDMDENTRRAITGIKVFEEFEGTGRERTKIGEVREVKTADKVRALELIGKHLKLFTEKHEHSGPDGKPIEHKNLSDLPDDQLDARIQAMLAKRPKESV